MPRLGALLACINLHTNKEIYFVCGSIGKKCRICSNEQIVSSLDCNEKTALCAVLHCCSCDRAPLFHSCKIVRVLSAVAAGDCRLLPQVTPTSDTDEFLFHSMLVGEFSSVRHFFCVPVCDLFYYSVISSKMATFFLACVDSHS